MEIMIIFVYGKMYTANNKTMNASKKVLWSGKTNDKNERVSERILCQMNGRRTGRQNAEWRKKLERNGKQRNWADVCVMKLPLNTPSQGLWGVTNPSINVADAQKVRVVELS